MLTKTKVYTFPRGGIQFEDPSAPSRDTCVTAFLPALSIFPLVHHTGSRALPVVSVGDSVKEGMLIGRALDPGSANIHAAVPGKVIRTVSWKMIEGHTNDALVIRLEGAFDKLGHREEIFPWKGLTSTALQALISEYGVVAMESSGLPASELIASFQAKEGAPVRWWFVVFLTIPGLRRIMCSAGNGLKRWWRGALLPPAPLWLNVSFMQFLQKNKNWGIFSSRKLRPLISPPRLQ
ncbi:hypothetical protein [Treponema primitia]|uniref:hypothetical protein n=1 Tax=Treponema primitia TaxID=88058 RepID=UPI003B3ADA90